MPVVTVRHCDVHICQCGGRVSRGGGVTKRQREQKSEGSDATKRREFWSPMAALYLRRINPHKERIQTQQRTGRDPDVQLRTMVRGSRLSWSRTQPAGNPVQTNGYTQ
eukprot:3903281-Rhodomonas_salina.1